MPNGQMNDLGREPWAKGRPQRMLRDSTGIASTHIDFDTVVERQGTDSMKWARYERDVLPLWVADMDFPAAAPVIQALRDRVDHGVFGYGFEPPELRGVVQARLQDRFGWRVEPEDLLFVPGVASGFNLFGKCFAGCDGGLLIQTPVYPPFYAIGKNIGCCIERAPFARTERGYEIDFELFEDSITQKTKAFLLCNPHNPVGRVFTRPELERLAEICLRHNLIICSDEIHQDFVYEGHTHIPIASLSPEVARQTVTLISPSKTYNIAGFHFAIAIATNPELRDRLCATGAGLIPGRPGILDFIAGLAAYQHGNPWLSELMPYLRANRDFLLRYLRDNLPGIRVFEPEGTYLAWLDCREAGIEGSPMEFFLREARVALQEGTLFGVEGEGFARLNFGCPRLTLEEALRRMKTALEGAARA